MHSNSWVVASAKNGVCERYTKGFAKGLAVVQLILCNEGRERKRRHVLLERT